MAIMLRQPTDETDIKAPHFWKKGSLAGEGGSLKSCGRNKLVELLTAICQLIKMNCPFSVQCTIKSYFLEQQVEFLLNLWFFSQPLESCHRALSLSSCTSSHPAGIPPPGTCPAETAWTADFCQVHVSLKLEHHSCERLDDIGVAQAVLYIWAITISSLICQAQAKLRKLDLKMISRSIFLNVCVNKCLFRAAVCHAISW